MEAVRGILADAERLCGSYSIGKAIKEGVRTVICGRPNAGKSSVMNALSRAERSIVTELSGTTRDVVTGSTELRGVRFLLSDTAGLRETGDPVERIGVERAREEIACAEVLLCVFDGSRPLCAEDLQLLEQSAGRTAVGVLNKCDLPETEELCAAGAFQRLTERFPELVRLSARTGENLPELERALCEAAGVLETEGVVIDNLRHRDCLMRCCEALRRAVDALALGLESELVEIDLVDAANALAQITGHSVGDEVIEGIFSRFCVGK